MRDPNNPDKIVIEYEDLYDDEPALAGPARPVGPNSHERLNNRSSPQPSRHAYQNQATTVSHGQDNTFRGRTCFNCRMPLYSQGDICTSCGARQNHTAMPHPSGKKRITYALFAIGLSLLGVHKFYLGQVGKGILYLLFAWTAIPGVLGLIEGIICLTMTDEEFNRKYLDKLPG